MESNNKNLPKWKKFEEFVASIQKKLTPHAKVTPNEFIIGKSNIKRQIDISVRYNLGQFNILAIIDCKDWSKPVDIADVGSFADLVEDVSSNKGAIICNAGFTDGAKKRAVEKGIDLFMAVDAENLDWPVYIALPVLCDLRRLKTYNLNFSYTSPAPFTLPAGDPMYFEIYRKDNTLNDIVINLLNKAWNEGRLPREEGEHENLRFIQDDAYTKVGDFLYGPVDITIDILIEKKLFFGNVPLKKGEGFADTITGKFTAKSFEWGIDIVEVQKKWQRIEKKDELAVKPSFVLQMDEHYPIIEYNK